MKTINTIALLVIILLIGLGLVFKLAVVNVPVNKVGVRTQMYGIPGLGPKGVAKKDFGPGWHRRLAGIDSWELFESTVQTLEMTREPVRGSMRGRDDVQVQSADGYAVSVDVTVKYKIMDGKAHKLFQDTGSGERYKTIVRNGARNACMAIFGQMKTEDFYDPAVRKDKAAVALASLRKQLEDNYVQILDVLIREVQFDPEYEAKIRMKKLADQEVELNKSEAKAAQMMGKTQVIEAETQKLVKIITEEKEADLITMQAETDREVAVIKAEYERFSTEKEADADLISAQREAEGTLLVRQAEAEGEKLRNEAMQGVGGSTIVALEAAKNLNMKDVTVSTLTIDLLDVDKMATKLGVPEE